MPRAASTSAEAEFPTNLNFTLLFHSPSPIIANTSLSFLFFFEFATQSKKPRNESENLMKIKRFNIFLLRTFVMLVKQASSFSCSGNDDNTQQKNRLKIEISLVDDRANVCLKDHCKHTQLAGYQTHTQSPSNKINFFLLFDIKEQMLCVPF